VSNYNEYTVTGNKWTRSLGGTFSNPYQGVPGIAFAEESVITLSDGTVVKQVLGSPVQQYLTTTISDPEQTFPLLDPISGCTAGTAKYQDVFNLLHSLYMYLATERDIRDTRIDLVATTDISTPTVATQPVLVTDTII
jgi:hypothetical protein